MDFIPVVSTIKSVVEVATGRDFIAGTEVDRVQAAAGLAASFVPGGKAALKGAKLVKAGLNAYENAQTIKGAAEAGKVLVDAATSEEGLTAGALVSAGTAAVGVVAMKKGKGKAKADTGAASGGGCKNPPGCFAAGTLVTKADGLVPIEEIRVGDRVMSSAEEDQQSSTEVDESWKVYTLTVKDRESRVSYDIELLRPHDWLKQQLFAPEDANTFWFEVEEMGLGGWAELRGVEESPEIGNGVGRVVLMTIRHKNTYIFEMKIGPRGPPITVTGYHPIYSQTRGGWAKVEELREGEELRTQESDVDLSRIGRVIGSQVVYNIEVESDNRYYVGESKVLVHNANCKEATAPKDAASSLPQLKGNSVTHTEKVLTKNGFQQTKVSNSAAKNQTWTHADGSEVRIHPYGNQNRAPYKSANNAHVHKQNPGGAQLNDRGVVSTDPNATHIGIRNPKDLPQVRGRPHGDGD